MRSEDSKYPSPTLLNDALNKAWHPENAELCYSQKGHSYWYKEHDLDAGDCFLELHYCHHKIAYAWLRWNPLDQEGILDDMEVKKAHRSQGLGRLLLSRSLSLARRRGMQSLSGPVSEIDVNENALEGRDILRWYREAGFETLPPSDPKRIATVRITLKAS